MTITAAAKAVPETFTVKLTDNGRNDLAMIAESLSITLDEALSRAVGTYAVLVEQDGAGTEIILKQKNGVRQSLPVRERGGNGGNGRHD